MPSSISTSQELSTFIEPAAAEIVATWLTHYNAVLTVTRGRKTKLGDYRSPQARTDPHRITINENLNKHAFLITTVHEFAHLVTYNHFKNKVSPHGLQWKRFFHELMYPFIKGNFFPIDVRQAITIYMTNPAASSCSDLSLMRILASYDKRDGKQVDLTPLERLSQGNTFIYQGRQYVKGPLLRKRYRCTAADSKVYLFFALALVRAGERYVDAATESPLKT